ncbi:hypothetical protein [Parapedobacter pyrenivorans]|uniref:hypothetical protein n=1 Tax=Parapedobacter pyrenivorans TaxID=1305674 RepID=UPI003342351F
MKTLLLLCAALLTSGKTAPEATLPADGTYFYGTLNGKKFTGRPGEFYYWFAGEDLFLSCNFSESEMFYAAINGMGATARTGTFAWYDGSSYAGQKGKAILQQVIHSDSYFRPDTWRKVCETGEHTKYQASEGGITISKIETANGETYLEGTMTATLWDNRTRCNAAKTADVTISFRITESKL